MAGPTPPASPQRAPGRRRPRFSREPLSTLSTWLEHALKLNVYELCGGRVISWRGPWRSECIEVVEIAAWQAHPEMGLDAVVIEGEDGRSVVWLDKHDDLIAILRAVASDRERLRTS